MPSKVLTLRLFGDWEAHSDNQPLPGLHLREGERLLAYLTLRHGVPVTYRQIAQQFWPSEANQNATGDSGDYPSTRQAIASLRRSLGDHADRLTSVSKGVARLDLAGAEVDLLRFEALVQQNDADAWRQAIALYRAPLLNGWTEKWTEEYRTRCQRSYERVAANLATLPAAPAASRPVIFATVLPFPAAAVPAPPVASVAAPVSPFDAGRLRRKLYIRKLYKRIAPDKPSGVCAARQRRRSRAVGLSAVCGASRRRAEFRQALERQGQHRSGEGRAAGRQNQSAGPQSPIGAAGGRACRADRLSKVQRRAVRHARRAVYLALCGVIALQLDLDVSPHKVWDQDFGPNMNLEWFLRRHVLKAIKGPLVWGMDEMDQTVRVRVRQRGVRAVSVVAQ